MIPDLADGIVLFLTIVDSNYFHKAIYDLGIDTEVEGHLTLKAKHLEALDVHEDAVIIDLSIRVEIRQMRRILNIDHQLKES